jgi:uncharacterized RDD family membrane protein YckC
MEAVLNQSIPGPESGAEFEAPSLSKEPHSESEPTAWRGELSAKLNRYRARRKAPPPRYPSLTLPFGTVNPSSQVPGDDSEFRGYDGTANHALALDVSCSDSASPQPDSAVIEPPPAAPPLLPSPQSGAKIIEFPRFAWAPPPPPPDQLAGPVGEQLRILEVPEVAPPPPALGGITIEPIPSAEPERRPGFDFPLQSAPLGRRLAASVIDGLIVACASALFGYIFWKIAAVRPPRMHLLSLAVGVPFVLWAAYQYLLIVYSATTPGLRAAGLELSHFDGTSTSRSIRRWRILASYLSAVSLGMGYAWVFLDEGALCWHDRITHTYLAPRKNTESKPRL